MNKTLLVGLVIIFITACNNIEQSRTEILTVSGERDTAIEKVRDLGRNLSGELERLGYYQLELMKPTATPPDLTPQQRTQLDQALGEFGGYNGTFARFMQEVGNFSKAFEDQKPQLEAMKQALRKKEKFDGNLNRTLNAIRKTNEATTGKVKAWEERLAKLSAEIESKYKEIRTLKGQPTE
jgi:chromosome segregation ATPase